MRENVSPSGITTSPSLPGAPRWTCAESGLSIPRTVSVQQARPERRLSVILALPAAPAGPFGIAAAPVSVAETTLIRFGFGFVVGFAVVVLVVVALLVASPPQPASEHDGSEQR